MQESFLVNYYYKHGESLMGLSLFVHEEEQKLMTAHIQSMPPVPGSSRSLKYKQMAIYLNELGAVISCEQARPLQAFEHLQLILYPEMNKRVLLIDAIDMNDDVVNFLQNFLKP